MGVFQATFSVSFQVRGWPTESECPSAVGPRNSGQFSPAKTGTGQSVSKSIHVVLRMEGSS